jgi:uncharacterized membrane-anchored protein
MRLLSRPILSLALGLLALPALAEMHPIQGPALGKLGDMAQIQIPKGFSFFEQKDMKEFQEKTHNLYSGDELGVLYDPDKAHGYIALFEFEDTGYIKDAAGEKLDPASMWKTMVENNDQANENRKKNKWDEIGMVRWEKEPQYNPKTQRLEWAVRLKEKNDEFVNFNTRILGRKGVMRVVLVPYSADLSKVLPDFNQAIAGFSYTSGNKYAEWTTGDKVADFGLAALVVGGAGALAAKTGLLAKLWGVIALWALKLWKLLVVGIAALSGFFKRLWAKLTGKNENSNRPPPSTP